MSRRLFVEFTCDQCGLVVLLRVRRCTFEPQQCVVDAPVPEGWTDREVCPKCAEPTK